MSTNYIVTTMPSSVASIKVSGGVSSAQAILGALARGAVHTVDRALL
jgi:hypothetical protein